jgi:thiol-disulfide isomerase/thioredoxin
MFVATDGAPAADFRLPDRDGRTVLLSAYKGKVILVNFWATWRSGQSALPQMNQHDVPLLLSRLPLFQELAADQFAAIASGARLVQVPKAEVLLHNRTA